MKTTVPKMVVEEEADKSYFAATIPFNPGKSPLPMLGNGPMWFFAESQEAADYIQDLRAGRYFSTESDLLEWQNECALLKIERKTKSEVKDILEFRYTHWQLEKPPNWNEIWEVTWVGRAALETFRVGQEGFDNMMETMMDGWGEAQKEQLRQSRRGRFRLLPSRRR